MKIDDISRAYNINNHSIYKPNQNIDISKMINTINKKIEEKNKADQLIMSQESEILLKSEKIRDEILKRREEHSKKVESSKASENNNISKGKKSAYSLRYIQSPHLASAPNGIYTDVHWAEIALHHKRNALEALGREFVYQKAQKSL